ncbi:MAG: glutamyl-tRNA reductase [Rhodospirillales bacterium]|jgi:glutamyl-tRNA reductase|nr:glutamyl-tRNA reductase [Rhodospirillales bacterium]
MDTLIVVGANPRSSSLGARDRLIPEPTAVEGLLLRLRAAGVTQAVMLTTCDRVEVYASECEAGDGAQRIIAMLADFAAMPADEAAAHLYVLGGEEAVRHVFSVAAALDGTVVGDPHVSAQLKDAWRLASAAGLLGDSLDALLQAAFAAAKQVRSRTGVGRAPVSLVASAVRLIEQVHGDPKAVRGLIVGMSEIGEMIAEAMRAQRLAHLSVAHPDAARAEAAARLLDSHVASWPLEVAELARADVIVACLGARRHLIDPSLVKRLLRARRYQPILLIDTAVPGDVDPAVDAVDAAFLYTLDDLEKVARVGLEAREKAASDARAIIEREVESFLRRRAERAAVPVLDALRRQFEVSRRAALEDAGGDSEKATRLLVNRLLHGPTLALRKAAGERDGNATDLDDLARAVRTLFGLGSGSGENSE